MSSLWTIVSPSQLSTGPGGCLLDVIRLLKRARVSAGVPRVRFAISFSLSLLNLKPAPASFGKKVKGVISAVPVM